MKLSCTAHFVRWASKECKKHLRNACLEFAMEYLFIVPLKNRIIKTRNMVMYKYGNIIIRADA